MLIEKIATTMKYFLSVLTALTIAPLSFAAPIEPKDVAANPALLAHVDVDALRASAIGRSILSQSDVQDKLAALAALFDFDLRSQLHGFTIYTTEDHPKDGALIVYADFDPNRLITLAKAASGFESSTNGSHVIYSWLNKKKGFNNPNQPRVFGAIDGRRVVFGQGESELAAALDVIDGKAPSYSAKNSLPEAGAGESILAQAVVLKFDFDSADQNAAIFKMSKSVRLKLSESGSNMSAAVKFEAKDSATATQISAVAQGLLAILKLQQANSNALELANAINIRQDDAAVTVALSTPSSNLIDMIKEGKQKTEKTEGANSAAESK